MLNNDEKSLQIPDKSLQIAEQKSRTTTAATTDCVQTGV